MFKSSLVSFKYTVMQLKRLNDLWRLALRPHAHAHIPV